MQSSCVFDVQGVMNTLGCPGVGSIGAHAWAADDMIVDDVAAMNIRTRYRRILVRLMVVQRSATLGVTLANLRPMGEHPDPVASQAGLILNWLISEDAERAARSIVARHRLPLESQDLVHLAWIRITTSFSARGEPLPSVHGALDAARYGYRVLSNLALDHLRSERRRAEILDRGFESMSGSVTSPEEHVLGLAYFEEVLRRSSTRRIESGNCGGCSPDKIRSIALLVVQSIALEVGATGPTGDAPQRGRDWMDRIVDSAIGRVSGEGDSARARKRASRCKACVRGFLVEVLEQMESHHD